MTTTIYTGECPKCGHEQTREWKGEPWVGYDGEASFAADCHECGPGVELTMFPEEPEDSLRSRIDGYCVRSVSEDDGQFEIVAAFDGVESHLSIGNVFREEAVEVALAGLRIDWVRREIERGTANAADIRVALEGAPALGWEGEEVSDLEEAFMLLAGEDELDAWRSEKVRRLAAEMDQAETAHRADPRPILIDAEIVEVWSSIDPKVNGTTMIVERRAAS